MAENDLNPAIAVLENRLADYERKANELRSAINLLSQEAGQQQKYPEAAAGSSGGGGPVLMQIKRDSFYGKKQMTAVREYLEMRRTQGNGPATPREIYDAMKAGGYSFSTKSDHVALVTLRALLRKATTVFHKLPGTGTYGLSAWYPDAKQTTADGNTNGGTAHGKSFRTTMGFRRKPRRKRSTSDNKSTKPGAAADPTAAPEGR